MLAHYDSDPRETAAGGVPYLTHRHRRRRLADGPSSTDRSPSLDVRSGSPAFLRGKIATARFYAEHVLPEAGPWRDEITMGAASTLALEEALF